MMNHHLMRLLVFRGSVCLLLALSLYNLPARADHGPATWDAAYQSVVLVNPTWPGYRTPGHGAPVGSAPAGSGVYYADNSMQTGFVLTAAHVINRATAIEIVMQLENGQGPMFIS
jgi:hypothetical protein